MFKWVRDSIWISCEKHQRVLAGNRGMFLKEISLLKLINLLARRRVKRWLLFLFLFSAFPLLLSCVSLEKNTSSHGDRFIVDGEQECEDQKEEVACYFNIIFSLPSKQDWRHSSFSIAFFAFSPSCHSAKDLRSQSSSFFRVEKNFRFLIFALKVKFQLH